MYRLDNSFAQRDFPVIVAGCGGTGGFVAEGLCRLLPRQASLVLVDHDRVEERNLSRQNFLREELGGFKSQVLAMRLARRYGRPVAYLTIPVGFVTIHYSGLVIGCVDNGLARGDIARTVAQRNYGHVWWIDAGNGDTYGQVLIGNRPGRAIFDSIKETCLHLPLPSEQRPELLQESPPRLDCAAAVAAGEQGPVINQAMAALVLEVVHRLIEGTCPWMQLWLDLEAGTLLPVPATPEAVKRIVAKKRKGVKFVKANQMAGHQEQGG